MSFGTLKFASRPRRKSCTAADDSAAPGSGSIQATSMGKKHSNKYAISNDLLCITDSFGETCYAVWKKGKEVRLIVGDSDFSLDGFLR